MIVSACIALPARAQVTGIRPASDAAILPRGGVMLLPLAADSPGPGWPDTVDVQFADGSTIAANVIWIEDAPDERRQWTDDPRELQVRAVEPSDRAAPNAGRPSLVARVPIDGSGPLMIAGHAVEARWMDVPPPNAPPPSAFADRMQLIESEDHPDLDSPFEFWRWQLVADRRGLLRPDPVHMDASSALVAEHYANLWDIGLERLRAMSPEAAERCIDLLTATVRDRGRRIAAWVIDPARIAELLSVLLDDDLSDAQIVRQANAWADQQPSLFAWTETIYGEQIELAIMNRADKSVSAVFSWENLDEPPMEVTLVPRVLTRVSMNRPALQPPGPLQSGEWREPPQQILVMRTEDGEFKLGFGPRVLAAVPPGALLDALRPPLRLFEAQAGLQETIDPMRATHCQVRKFAGRWEVFIECHRPNRDAVREVPENYSSSSSAGALIDMLGFEAITLFFGQSMSQGPPQAILTIPEAGWHQLVQGANDGSLEVHRRSYDDRWYCRVVLPRTWYSETPDQPLLVGLLRTHGDSYAFETGPTATVSWRPDPSRAAIDLSRWDEIPGSQVQGGS